MKCKTCKCGNSLPANAELADALERNVREAEAMAAAPDTAGHAMAYGQVACHASIVASQLRGVCFSCWYKADKERRAAEGG